MPSTTAIPTASEYEYLLGFDFKPVRQIHYYRAAQACIANGWCVDTGEGTHVRRTYEGCVAIKRYEFEAIED